MKCRATLDQHFLRVSYKKDQERVQEQLYYANNECATGDSKHQGNQPKERAFGLDWIGETVKSVEVSR